MENRMFKVVFSDYSTKQRVPNQWTGFASHEEARRFVEDHDMCIPLEWSYDIVSEENCNA